MMARCCGLLLGLAATLAAPAPTFGQDYFARGEERPVRRVPGQRTHGQRVLLYSLAGATLATAAIATGFALHSHAAAEDVSTQGAHTGLIYTQAREDRRASAVQSRGIATAGFALSGAALAATIGFFIATHPDPVEVKPRAAVAPTQGGAVLAGTWSF